MTQRPTTSFTDCELGDPLALQPANRNPFTCTVGSIDHRPKSYRARRHYWRLQKAISSIILKSGSLKLSASVQCEIDESVFLVEQIQKKSPGCQLESVSLMQKLVELTGDSRDCSSMVEQRTFNPLVGGSTPPSLILKGRK